VQALILQAYNEENTSEQASMASIIDGEHLHCSTDYCATGSKVKSQGQTMIQTCRIQRPKIETKQSRFKSARLMNRKKYAPPAKKMYIRE
jgi:hypothetical protein